MVYIVAFIVFAETIKESIKIAASGYYLFSYRSISFNYTDNQVLRAFKICTTHLEILAAIENSRFNIRERFYLCLCVEGSLSHG